MTDPISEKSPDRHLAFWDRTWVQMVLLIFVYPVGAILIWVKAKSMWEREPWMTGVKLFLTIALGFMFLAVFKFGCGWDHPGAAPMTLS